MRKVLGLLVAVIAVVVLGCGDDDDEGAGGSGASTAIDTLDAGHAGGAGGDAGGNMETPSSDGTNDGSTLTEGHVPLTITDTLELPCATESDCADELSCIEGVCSCCRPEEGQCNATLRPAEAIADCGERSLQQRGQDALANVGEICWSTPGSGACAPQLLCDRSPINTDDRRCSCCLELDGRFQCEATAAFAREHCLAE